MRLISWAAHPRRRTRSAAPWEGKAVLFRKVCRKWRMEWVVERAKHLKVLRDQGLVVANRAKMHRIPPERLVSREEAVIDYGTCLLRLGAAK